MAKVQGTFYSGETQRRGTTPVSPPNAVDDPVGPINPPGSGGGSGHNPVTIGSPANGLSISGSQELTIGLASGSATGALSNTDWNTFNEKLNLTSPLTGYTVGANTALANTDTILQAFGKVQGQINARVSGTIASGQVAFGTAVNTVGGSSNLTYNSSTQTLQLASVMQFSSAGGVFTINSLVNNAVYRTPIFHRFQTGVGNNDTLVVSGSGNRVGVNILSPTDTLDVNGTLRVRTVNPLGTAPTTVWVGSATGVLSSRTLAEFAGDLGVNTWTTVGSDIFRNSAVAIGRTTIPTNATFAVQSITVTASHKFIQFLNNSGSELLSIQQNGISTFTQNVGIGKIGESGYDLMLGGTTNTNKLAIRNSEGSLQTQINNSGNFYHTGIIALGTSSFNGLINIRATSAGQVLLNANSNAGALTALLRESGGLELASYLYVGNRNVPIAMLQVRGAGTGTGQTLTLEDSTGADTFQFLDNGNLSIPSTNGAKIGTATTQKFAFWNATPIVQPLETALANTPNSGDANTDALINALKNVILNTGLARSA